MEVISVSRGWKSMVTISYNVGRWTFRLSSGSKSKPGVKPYIPEDRVNDALQNLVYHNSAKFGRGRQNLCSGQSIALPLKNSLCGAELFDFYAVG